DQDRYTLERSIEISSREMQGLYEELKHRSASELAVERQRVIESLARLRATLEATTEGILVVDQQRNVVAVNVRFAKIFNVPAALLASSDHRAIIAHALYAFADPDAERARIEAIHATREVVHDELLLGDGRIID